MFHLAQFHALKSVRKTLKPISISKNILKNPSNSSFKTFYRHFDVRKFNLAAHLSAQLLIPPFNLFVATPLIKLKFLIFYFLNRLRNRIEDNTRFLFGCLIHTLTLLSTLILASVCIRLICDWIDRSSLQLNSFLIASSNMGNEICSLEPT